MIQALIGPIASLLDKIIPDAGERQKLAHEIATMAERQAHEIALAQIEVNKEEAKSSDAFRGGWRPFIGWTCGTAFALHFVVFPVLNFFLVAAGEAEVKILFDMNTLLTVLGGLLGLGAFRSFEKVKGLP
jgi:hypothetical protein